MGWGEVLKLLTLDPEPEEEGGGVRVKGGVTVARGRTVGVPVPPPPSPPPLPLGTPEGEGKREEDATWVRDPVPPPTMLGVWREVVEAVSVPWLVPEVVKVGVPLALPPLDTLFPGEEDVVRLGKGVEVVEGEGDSDTVVTGDLVPIPLPLVVKL